MGRPRKDYSKAIRMRKKGLSYSQIGKRLDPPMTKQGVQRALKLRGIR